MSTKQALSLPAQAHPCCLCVCYRLLINSHYDLLMVINAGLAQLIYLLPYGTSTTGALVLIAARELMQVVCVS